MLKVSTITGWYVVTMVFFCLALQATEEPTPSNIDFEYGLSCSLLAELNKTELTALIHTGQQAHLDYFCQAESIYNCSDYNDFLYQLAHFEKQDEVMCRLIPHL